MAYDVIVVGAGPAGSSAAHAAAAGGARVLVVDRAQFPRYKTCGGGLIGPTLAALPEGFGVPSRMDVHRATFSQVVGGRTVAATGSCCGWSIGPSSMRRCWTRPGRSARRSSTE